MTFGNVEQNFAISTTKLFDVALKWWESFRPEGWTVVQHLEQPHINIRYNGDKLLATEIVRILKDEVME